MQTKLDRINHCALYWSKYISNSSFLKPSNRSKIEEVSSLSLENAELNDTI